MRKFVLALLWWLIPPFAPLAVVSPVAQERGGGQEPSFDLPKGQKNYHSGSIRLLTQENQGEFAGQDTYSVGVSTDAANVDRVLVGISYATGKGDKEVKAQSCFAEIPKNADLKNSTAMLCAPFPVSGYKVKTIDVWLYSQIEHQTFEVSKIKADR